MKQSFHMTGGLRVVSTIITTLLRLGLPVGPSVLLSVRGRKSGKIYTIPIELVENSGTRFLIAAFGEVNWVRNLRAAGQAHPHTEASHRSQSESSSLRRERQHPSSNSFSKNRNASRLSSHTLT